ncbi:MAG: hypothetical protein J1E41_04835 [Ruminococcus sp.]|nr:hypothetical protein [Ruminococcus sp.]
MPDINDLFEQFPDYDVFSGKTTPIQKVKKRKAVQKKMPEPRSNTDYGDGFEKSDKPSKVKKRRVSNFMTLFFFPVLIIWLEISLRLGCGEHFNLASILYLIGFSISIALALTLICTFAGRIFNLVLCNIFSFIITAFFAFELIYFNIFKSFFSFSQALTVTQEQVLNAINDRKIYLIAIIIPFVINLLIGHRIFLFHKIRIPAKISLILVAVLVQLIAITTVSISKETNKVNSSYNIYHGELSDNSVQEKFGLLTMERLSLFPSK